MDYSLIKFFLVSSEAIAPISVGINQIKMFFFYNLFSFPRKIKFLNKMRWMKKQKSQKMRVKKVKKILFSTVHLNKYKMETTAHLVKMKVGHLKLRMTKEKLRQLSILESQWDLMKEKDPGFNISKIQIMK